MSDFDTLKAKVKEGNEWRGTIDVTVDGEEIELTVRQLSDPEFLEVMSLIDRDELQELRSELPEDLYDEYTELQEQESLSDEERERLDELEARLQEESGSIFDTLSEETFEGIRTCAKYAVVPDEEDMEQAFRERAAEIEREYGIKVQTPEDVREPLEDEIEYYIDNATNFVSFFIGIQALVETVGDEGN